VEALVVLPLPVAAAWEETALRQVISFYKMLGAEVVSRPMASSSVVLKGLATPPSAVVSWAMKAAALAQPAFMVETALPAAHKEMAVGAVGMRLGRTDTQRSAAPGGMDQVHMGLGLAALVKKPLLVFMEVARVAHSAAAVKGTEITVSPAAAAVAGSAGVEAVAGLMRAAEGLEAAAAVAMRGRLVALAAAPAAGTVLAT
jgi:hypothetical protein